MSKKDSFNPSELLEGLYNILKNDGERLNECGCPDEMTDEELSMFSRKNVGKRSGAFQGENPWNHLHKKGRTFKGRVRKEDAGVEECAGVGIITKQNSTKDVNKSTPQKNLDAFNLEEALNEMAQTLIRENKIRKGTQKAVPSLETWADLDNNNSTYAAYRYGVALAGSPSETMDKHGPVGGKLVTIGYTDEDCAILDQAAKTMGVSQKHQGTKGSQELDDVNKQSAISPAKRNRYGI